MFELFQGIVATIYFIALLVFMFDSKSPISGWTNRNPWISVPLFFILGGIGGHVIFR